MTLVDFLRNSAIQHPDQLAYICRTEKETYEGVYQKVKNIATHLIEMGVQKGDPVALLLNNSSEFLLAYYGILTAGAVVIPINPIYTQHEIQYILENSQSKIAIATNDLKAAFTQLHAKCFHLNQVVFVGEEPQEEWAVPFTQLVEAPVGIHGDFPTLTEDDLSVILYTSGTTGRPKGAMLSHGNLGSNALAIVEQMGIKKDVKAINVLPMFHVFGMTVGLNATISLGGTLVIVPRFSPKEVVETIRDTKATLLPGVPTMYNFLLNYEEATREDLSSLTICMSGGAAMPVALLNNFEEKFGLVIYEGYGLSESSPFTHFSSEHRGRRIGAIGRNVPGVTCKVVDEEDVELPRGQVGELAVQGPNVMKGYLNMPEETAYTMRNGWLHTGDMAYIDEEGFAYIVDRKKDMVIVGGYNVYPREVEEVLYKHASIVEAAVTGVPDEAYGEIVCAYVVVRDPFLTEETIIEYCKEHLAKYKVPRKVVFMEELPKNTTGKILRRVLRDRNTVNVK